MRILLIEDEPRVVAFLERGLREEGHAVDAAGDGDEAMAMASASEYDVIVLDLVLPDRSGFEVASELRATGDRTPILMLTARDAREDVVRGLDLGADDYLTKPFEFEELLARIRALARRGSSGEEAVLHYEDVELDRLRRQAQRAGEEVDLTPTEFRLLEALMRTPDQILSRRELLDRVWGIDFEPGTSLVEVHLANLRRKLESGGRGRIIETIRGRGFRLRSPVER
ncbi:MAG: response regulator transcription factor [Chloroflexi bacterium]|nr:response regulator transcription factor [Chloroflexota bacterium]